jgi:hypothetical protein
MARDGGYTERPHTKTGLNLSPTSTEKDERLMCGRFLRERSL